MYLHGAAECQLLVLHYSYAMQHTCSNIIAGLYTKYRKVPSYSIWMQEVIVPGSSSHASLLLDPEVCSLPEKWIPQA